MNIRKKQIAALGLALAVAGSAAGVGIYAVTAVLSVTGMAWTAKKRH